jgi:hypothetical protein
MPRDRNCIFGTQAIFRPRNIAREIKLTAEILARIEEDRRRLQDWRLAARISGGNQMRHGGFRIVIKQGQRASLTKNVKIRISLSKPMPALRQVSAEKVNEAKALGAKALGSKALGARGPANRESQQDIAGSARSFRCGSQ